MPQRYAVKLCSSEDRRGCCRIGFRAASGLADNPDTSSVRQRPEGEGSGLCFFGCASEGQLEAQLNLTRGGRGRVNIPGVRSVDCNVINRRLEVGVVENVEELGPELRDKPLGDVSILKEREVYVDQLWSVQGVPSVVTQYQPVSGGRGGHKASGVEITYLSSKLSSLGVPD